MPKYGPFLPDIYTLIYKTLEQNNLTPDFYFTEENFYKTLESQRFFIVPVKDPSGEKYIFKTRIENYSKTKELFNREIEFIEYSSNYKVPELNTPKLIERETAPIEWILYKFIETSPSGDMSRIWKRHNLNIPIKEVSLLPIKLQKATKTIPNEYLKKIPKKSGKTFIKEFDVYKGILKKNIENKKIIKIREELVRNKRILDKSSVFLCHGDFHQGNILINIINEPSPNHTTPYIIDWANLQLNNYVYDIAFLWAMLNQYPKLQRDLTENFIKHSPKTEDFDHLFKLNLIRIIPQLVEIFDYISKKTGENFDKQIDFLLKEFRIIRYSNDEINKARKKILSKLKLSETKLLRKAELNETPDFEISLCKNKKTEGDFILKIMHRSYDDLKNRFEKEAEIAKFFTKNKKDICLQYVKSDMKSRPEWFAYKFLEGEKIGNFYRISPKFLTENLTESVFADILEIQKEYCKMPKKLKNSLCVNLEEKKNKLSDDIERMVKNGFVSKNIAEKNKIIYNSNVNKIPLFLNHNDLHPENLIIDKEKVRIIDFNLASLNSQFFDFLTFILCGWENREWIKKSLQKLCELYPELKEKDSITRLSFDLSLIEATVKLILQAFPDKKNLNNLSREIKYSNSAQQYFIEIFKKLDLFL